MLTADEEELFHSVIEKVKENTDLQDVLRVLLADGAVSSLKVARKSNKSVEKTEKLLKSLSKMGIINKVESKSNGQFPYSYYNLNHISSRKLGRLRAIVNKTVTL